MSKTVRAVIKNSSGEVVATETFVIQSESTIEGGQIVPGASSIPDIERWIEQTKHELRRQDTFLGNTLIKKDFDGALYSGMSLRVTAGIDAALDRVTTALKGGGALPRIDSTSSGKGWLYSEDPIGLWLNRYPAQIGQVEYKTTSSTMQATTSQSQGQSQGQSTGVSQGVYGQGRNDVDKGLGRTKAFDSLGALEWDGKPVSDILYAPIVEPEDPDTMGFIAG